MIKVTFIKDYDKGYWVIDRNDNRWGFGITTDEARVNANTLAISKGAYLEYVSLMEMLE